MTNSKEINLIIEVKNLLYSSGLKINCDNNFLKNPIIENAIDYGALYQREYLNKFWLYQLVQFGSESINQRFCLVDSGTPQEWLQLFRESILPFVIEKNLPLKIH